MRIFPATIAALFLTATPARARASDPGPPPSRIMAITVDDLVGWEAKSQRTTNAAILRALGEHHVPAVGFVNETQLYYPPEGSRILETWLAAGMELGNHTYAHLDLNKVGAEAFKADILRGETVTRPLLAKRNAVPRWFRYPFLRTGRTAEDKSAVQAFLLDHGYSIAPVTLENDDWMFSRAYEVARKAGNAKRTAEITAMYLAHWTEVLDFYEGMSRELFGREIAHVALVHDNPLNADQLGAVLALFEARGYRFVPLEVALQDDAYTHADTYVGGWGKSWLQRWWVTEGRPSRYREEPPVPDSIAE